MALSKNSTDGGSIEAAIFDMDGLLIDSERPSQAAWFRTTEQYNLDPEPELFLSLIGVNETTTLEVLTKAFDGVADAVQFRRDWTSNYLQLLADEPVELKAGVHELLQWLEANGIKRAVATSTGIELAESKLRRVGIRDYFYTVTGGDQIKNGKPAPDIYLAAAASVDANPVQCVGLEDSPNGVRAAHAAGMVVVQVPDLVQPDNELMSLGHKVLDNLFDVQAWLLEVHN